MFRAVRVWGWSAPSTRAQSARACSNSGMARPRSPADSWALARLFRERQGVGVVGAQHPLAVDQGLLQQRDGPAQVPRRLVGAGEVVPRDQGVGVVGAQHPLAVDQGLLEQRDGPAQVPRVLVGTGEVVPRGQGGGVVGTQQPRVVGQGTLEVPGRAAGLALAVEEQPGLVEEVGGGVGVGVWWRVAGQGVDVREQHPPARPARRVSRAGEGTGELAGGLVPGGVDRLGITVEVARVGGAGHAPAPAGAGPGCPARR